MTKQVETSKAPNGKYIYQIGEVDDMGGGFGCFFIDKSSGSWTHYDEDGKPVSYAHRAAHTEFTGEFFDTRAEALAAGKATL
jgi:hypothetical protein